MGTNRWLGMAGGLMLLAACGGGGGDTGSSNDNGLPPPPPGPITSSAVGRVLTPGGTAVAGVTITAYKTNDHTQLVTTTDANGNYQFSGLQTGTLVNYEFWAEKTGYAFYPAVNDSDASIIKSDHNGLFRTVISYFSVSGSNLSASNFTAYGVGSSLVSLPQTGQVASFAVGDDGSLHKGLAWPGARFTDNQNGTVTDNLTGLIWLKNAGCISASVWVAALTATNQLASGNCGLSDGSSAGQWHLPNITELESLVDIANRNPALPTGHPFSNVAAAYWSSTTYRGDTNEAWVIRMTDGRYMNDLVTNVKATASLAGWAVRSSSGGTIKLPASGQFIPYAAGDDANAATGVPITSPRFIDKGDGTVADTVSGLTWLKKADCFNLPWAASLAAISSLASGQCGLSDGSSAGSWRMPNRAEMLSLSDRALDNHADYFIKDFMNADGTVARPAIFNRFVTAQFYWTSSTNTADVSQAWTVYSCDFGAYNIAKADQGYALAVR